MVQQRFEV